MTLPKKPPLQKNWDLANAEKRRPKCRVCGKVVGQVSKFELAHVIGQKCDLKDVSVCEIDGHSVRVAVVKPDRVVNLCGPSVDTGTCHNLYDSHRLDLWDFLTDAEKAQAIADCDGNVGQALHRCAPLTWLERVEMRGDVAVEVAA